MDDAEDAEVILHEYGHAIHFSQNFSFASAEAGAISEETFRRGMEKAQEDLERANASIGDLADNLQKAFEIQRPAAREFRFTSGVPGRNDVIDPMKENTGILKKIDRSEQWQVRLLDRIANAVERSGEAGEVVGF